MAEKKVKIKLQDEWREDGKIHPVGKELEIPQDYADDLAAHGLRFQIITAKDDK